MKIIRDAQVLKSPEHYWNLLVRGDKIGLEGIYCQYAPELFAFGMSLVPDYDFVQDCIQEVFLDIWKYHRNLHGVSNIKIYLFKSTSHKIFKEIKRAKKTDWAELNEENLSLVSIEPVESELVKLQAKEYLQVRVANVLEKLPKRQKQVLNHLFFDHFTYEEVAKIMGINLRSTYTLAWKAITTVKKHLSGDR